MLGKLPEKGKERVSARSPQKAESKSRKEFERITFLPYLSFLFLRVPALKLLLLFLLLSSSGRGGCRTGADKFFEFGHEFGHIGKLKIH